MDDLSDDHRSKVDGKSQDIKERNSHESSLRAKEVVVLDVDVGQKSYQAHLG